ncbi:SLC13 family permease [Diplocloster agilis]|uniref:SLC13 family permease n=1 Tax=Diplocloster agilis TaxID=2850323 RepID=UPI0008222D60|nr:SLC13 family permease [Suonthocola fibrivorans]MCU6735108.1 hypothetical protein [Suonthocola fibrivorans]SCJ64494.1 Dicarboxylate carrier protein MatC N-terminus [uncultured Clostridium sp.]
MNSVALGWIALLVFILTIVIGVKRKLNLGILAFAVAFVFGLFVKVDGGAMSSVGLKGVPVTSLFPFNIFWLTLSVSLMLNVGSSNGTFDVIISKLVGMAHGRRAIIPIIVFAVMFIACSAGAGSTGVVVLLCTIAATISKDQDIDPVFMLLAVLSGSTVAIGSPVAVIGIICNTFSEDLWGERIAPSYMYPRAAAMAILTFAVIYIIYGGWKLKKRPVDADIKALKLNRQQIITLIGFAAFILLTIVIGFEMGLAAFMVTAILLFLKCADEKKIIAEVPWASILLICGMCVLIGVVTAAGGIDIITNFLKKLMNQYTVKPIYSILGSLLAMVSSVTGVVLPSLIPTIPDIAVSTGTNPYALVTALAYGANITCASPLSSMGAIALGIMGANLEYDISKLFKLMLIMSFILMAVSAVWAAIGIAG